MGYGLVARDSDGAGVAHRRPALSLLGVNIESRVASLQIRNPDF